MTSNKTGYTILQCFIANCKYGTVKFEIEAEHQIQVGPKIQARVRPFVLIEVRSEIEAGSHTQAGS